MRDKKYYERNEERYEPKEEKGLFDPPIFWSDVHRYWKELFKIAVAKKYPTDN
jgi:hypothetical protein